MRSDVAALTPKPVEATSHNMVDWTLAPHPFLKTPNGPLVLVVMDGMGVGPQDDGDAIWLANTPVLDRLHQTSLRTTLGAHGQYVGLPTNQDMGNSEVGHNALGAGRVFDQGAILVNHAIETGALFRSELWQQLMSGATLHLIGLLSDGNVHSHEKHLHALLRAAHADGVQQARVHVLLDGRDVPDPSALIYVDRLEALLASLNADYRIASGGGRMVTTMDRYEADWSIVERGWNAHVHGQARRFPSARTAIETYRSEQAGISDQYLPPFVVDPISPIQDGDSVICFNFRGDRVIALSRAFEETQEPFSGFERGRCPTVQYAGIVQYDGDLHLPTRYLVEPPAIDQTFGEYLAYNRVTQWACSETQKYGHVTYFWNGNRSGYIDKKTETYLEIQSDVVPFDQAPQMKATEITNAAIQAIQNGTSRFLRLNYPNGDMVGHTGNLEATIKAVEAVDVNLGRLMEATLAAQGVLMVTADHGNADEMFLRDTSGAFLRSELNQRRPCTSHTCNPVPLYIAGGPAGLRLTPNGGLANVAATALALLGYQAPTEYEPSLLVVPSP